MVSDRKINPYRFAAPAVGLILFLAISAMYAFGESGIYYGLMYHWGIVPFTFPFLDTSGALAAWECTRLGRDVVEHDPCDILGRAYSYSPLWMYAAAIPLGVLSTAKVGWALGFAFLVSLVLLPAPHRAWELAMVILATISPMVVYAVERGNPDLIVFMLATLAGFTALTAPPIRFLTYPIALFGALALKYYPITLLILALRERLSVFIAVNTGALLLITIFVLSYFSDLQRGVPLIPAGPYFTELFSAQNLPRGIASGLEKFGFSTSEIYLVVGGVYTLMLLTSAKICWFVLKSGRIRAPLMKLDRHEMIFLVIGSSLIVGCFFAAQNIGYRGIFLLFVIPGLLAIARNGDSRTTRDVGIGTAAVAVLLMWGECVRLNLLLTHGLSVPPAVLLSAILVYFWLLREFTWWWVISILTTILIEFVLASEMAQAALPLISRHVGSRRRR